MSIPNIIYRDDGAQFDIYTNLAAAGGMKLGQTMYLNQGERRFHLVKASATATVAANLYQTNTLGVVAGTADADALNALVVSTAAVAGSSTIGVTMAGTAAVSKDLLAEGWLFTSAGTVGAGYCYRIKTNTVAGSTVASTITIYETFIVALPASSSLVGVRQNAYNNITITTADTVGTGPILGISPRIIPASSIGWIQYYGPCAAQQGGTNMIAGIPIVPSGTTGGAVSTVVSSTTATRKDVTIIGYCMQAPAATTGVGLVFLTLG